MLRNGIGMKEVNAKLSRSDSVSDQSIVDAFFGGVNSYKQLVVVVPASRTVYCT